MPDHSGASPLPLEDDDVRAISPPPATVSSPSTSSHAPAPPATSSNDADDSASNKPPSNSPPVSKSKSSAKPKSSKQPKHARTPSPSPPPLPPPPPLRTIRLEIRLGGPDNYAVDIALLAKNTGQRPPTPEQPPVKHDSSDSEDDDADGKKKKVKGKKKNPNAEYYDLNDPFIDDSDLAVDERTWFAQTKQQGFYVSSGEVALLKDKSKKPKSTKKAAAPVPTIVPLAGTIIPTNLTMSLSAVAAASIANSAAAKSQLDALDANSATTDAKRGSRESPIPVASDMEGDSTTGPTVESSSTLHPTSQAMKRKSSEDSNTGNSVNGNGLKKKRKTIDIESFHPELQRSLYDLKDAINKESFEQKGKFPPSLKPVLAQVALKAIILGQYNDSFFSLMPQLFIYNKFTMTKLIKRTVYADHQLLLSKRQDELLAELKQNADEGFSKAKEEYEKNLAAWEKRQEKAKADAVVASVEGTPVPTPTPLPPRDDKDDADPDIVMGDANADKDKDGKDKDGKDKDPQPPAKKYRLTEKMKGIIWELVVLSNESCRIENEKHTLEGSTATVSEQGTRKVLYQKVVAAFPDGWMSSGQISREVSVMKKKFEAAQQQEE